MQTRRPKPGSPSNWLSFGTPLDPARKRPTSPTHPMFTNNTTRHEAYYLRATGILFLTRWEEAARGMAKTADSWVFIGPTTLRYFSLVLLSVCLGFVCATSPHGSSFPQELLVDSNRAINFADLNYDIDVNVIEEKNTRNRRDSSTSRNSNLTANHFYLWTRTNAGNTSYNDLDPGKPDTIKNSTFVPRTTYIIVHGFLGWGIEPWILFMKDITGSTFLHTFRLEYKKPLTVSPSPPLRPPCTPSTALQSLRDAPSLCLWPTGCPLLSLYSLYHCVPP
ncbi:hypothetical protein C7M84_002026 [Penaeus vannamei]|uniref:Uncharacterized protein n=1 Tax=Penaeus vannamei TaxID=6689 RepID=A0A423TS16_PENVA|nr:hypothetical protein C7M84_002026 [Penaeus vannamei]